MSVLKTVAISLFKITNTIMKRSFELVICYNRKLIKLHDVYLQVLDFVKNKPS